MTPFALPPGYARIRVVQSFHELVSTPFTDGINACCWLRALAGDFGEIVAALGTDEGTDALDEARLRALALSAAGRAGVETLLTDLRLLRAQGLDPVLNCFAGYPRDEEPGIVCTDVYSFHADRAPVPAETYLCTYHGAPSEGLRNDEARRRIDLPDTRAALLRDYGGEDDADFEAHLSEHCYDLHYAPLPEARPFSFGVGHLWRIAIAHPGCPVPPCIHRAPETLPGAPARLLLIS